MVMVSCTQCCSAMFVVCRISDIEGHGWESMAVTLDRPICQVTLKRTLSGRLPSRSQLPQLAVTTLTHNSKWGHKKKKGQQ